MNWKQIKSVWQSVKDDRWNSHPKGHRAKKKTEKQNRTTARKIVNKPR